jgi:DNA-binding NarL/FixJ family response regulator
MKIRILLVENQKMFRDGLYALFEKLSYEMEIVGTAENGKLAIEMVSNLKPDVIISNIALPMMNTIEIIKKIIEQNPDIKVIFLTAFSESKYVMEGISAGAAGFVFKECEFGELVRAINVVIGGMHYLCPQAASSFINETKNSRSNLISKEGSVLTKRERQVLQLIAKGNSSKEIAAALLLSERTVTAHRQNIMDKTGCHDIASMTRYAIQQNIAPPIERE